MPLFMSRNPHPYRPHLPTWRQPMYLHLRPLWLALQETLGTCEGRLLDVGCGLKPYREMMGPKVTEHVGVDRPGPLSTPDVEGTAEALPFEDGSFDVVLATQVFEHLPDPRVALTESVRVLRPGGRLILTVPGVWPTHEAPHDYWRFTRHGLEHLIDQHGLERQRQLALGGAWATIGQMINLELASVQVVRELVPLVNLVARALDSLGSREDLVMNWLVDAVKKR